MAIPESEGQPSAAVRLLAGDPRFTAVLDRQFNKRFRANPDYIQQVHSTADVMMAVQDAVGANKRVVATSGGHCLDGFVSDPEVRVLIDLSPMKRIYHDPKMRAVAVDAGATVGETHRALFEQWGVVLPLGEYPGIGMGGHIAGGAFGFLCRQHGLAADHLHAVEVVTVDADGKATRTIATSDANDPHCELWWAHTGGGAGNFGIATRFWFRTPGAGSDNPAEFLPRAPESVTLFKAEWAWSELREETFLALLRNHGTWSEQNVAGGSPNASLFTSLEGHRKEFGKIVVRGVSTAGADADRQWKAHLKALTAGTLAPNATERQAMSWLDFALNPFPELFTGPPGGVSSKMKDAMLKRRLTDAQIRTAFRYLTTDSYGSPGGLLGFASYGGRVNTVASGATASAQRATILDIACNAGWVDPKTADVNIRWVRDFYRELFAETGGVPVPGDAYDGAFINHPDPDLADPAINASGVPWSTIYYHGNYPRLQRIKAQWDPRDVFRHALSVRLPATA